MLEERTLSEKLRPRGRLEGRSLTVALPDLSGGGTERLYVGLTPYFQQAGLKVTFLLNQARGELMELANAPVVVLNQSRQLAGLPNLIWYLRTSSPDFLMTNMEHMNVLAVIAKFVARAPTRIVASQHNSLSRQAARAGLKNRALPLLYRMAMPNADRVVAVSNGVRADLIKSSHIASDKISVIYNGVVTDDFEARAAQSCDLPFLNGPGPLVVAAGRMAPQKDHRTLLKAFALVARRHPTARLAIVGDGPLRGELQQLAGDLAIADRVHMPGFLHNALALISRAQLVVLSSQYEGFGLVVAEAIACGVPVVSTDCHYGPAEILDNGAFGTLVAVGNFEAMADAIEQSLKVTPDRERLRARGREFSMSHCAAQYLALLRSAVSD